VRRIEKGREPSCLNDLRSTPGADWSSVHGTQKQAMREAAFAEQHGLCAYCSSKLPMPASAVGMGIDHFETRAAMAALQFEWTNLLGVCLGDRGGDGDHRARYHCDNYRGKLDADKQALELSPAAFPPDVGRCFTYTIAGEMCVAPNLTEPLRTQAEATIDRLNLNIPRLQRNRQAVIEKLRAELRKKAPREARVRELLALATTPDRDGFLPPYCQILANYLEKKLRQLDR
jgi:uncharacterized protein (TIGR02646 family)